MTDREADGRGASETGDPLLLTPGPLTTSASVKRAMLHDWGSRDRTFLEMNERVLARIAGMANATATHACVPMQGSGTFAVEAMIGTMVPRDGKLLVLVNGAYGTRAARICARIGRAVATLETPEDTPPDLAALERRLAEDQAITHVLAVQCETTSGILNPVEEIATLVADAGRALLIDAMSAFGALPLDAGEVPFQALAASSNKCLEGVPGLGFVLCERGALAAAAGNAPSLALDLADQQAVLEKTGQYRFTPPIHVIAALDQAIAEHAAEGGVTGRGARYAENCQVLVDGMRTRGFETLLPDELQAPIIVTFRMPADPAFDFTRFYDGLAARGYLIYPGKLTVAESFRIGCIGRLARADMEGALAAVDAVLAEMGVTSVAA
ncbi:2-aminoethylphosphonate--pyruvate transaminase [Marivibrio halodurans]|uniref:2-aminoethylphosphonate--pyruvate transaminase n=1 Tax=Marivibrio halodurans TaxID=2039722 RepID=A0A8J7S3F6_9PROT|nr:2-aminoethylphosphonate--pyruvate transaminase [Marivibrio halodurans]MBP5857863.1 2-aminoethylphosphonate--pyruvate transaminase [Marivibrio halodurans]